MRIFLGLLLVLLLAGCQTTTNHYLGAVATADTLIELPTADVTDQRWQDLYVTVDYALKRQAGQLSIEGLFMFSDYPQMNLRKARDVKLRLFLLDKEHKVLQYKEIARTFATDLSDKVAFNESFSLTPEVAALAFGYEGELIGDGRREIDFIRKLPRVAH